MEARLHESITRWNLLDSKFYQAWSAGTLPVEALRDYAHEYGAFISLIAKGWDAHGDHATAAVEREHVELWSDFAASLGTTIGAPKTQAVRKLRETADVLFSEKASSLGALYAFEAQQPATSRSKLEGLRAHYTLAAKAETYFDVHKDDDDEPRLLLRRMSALSAEDQSIAAEACETMCELLRGALDELYDRHAVCMN
ncbi:MAG: iron-containing redox enzyme family protein [Acidobacteria bacterium]|nr:iron-containing redox enzyme family protein [Acidobacteriota bacterium]